MFFIHFYYKRVTFFTVTLKKLEVEWLNVHMETGNIVDDKLVVKIISRE